jgi:Tfp pilus assembly protein PilF
MPVRRSQPSIAAPALAVVLALGLGVLHGCPDPRPAAGIPEDVIRDNILGTAYLGQQKWGDAEAAFRRALDRRGSDPLLLTNAAVALVQQGRIDEAEALLQQALGADPDYPYARYNLGLIEKNRGNFEPAREHFEAVARRDPEDLLTQYNLGIVLSRLERGAEAETAFRNALARNPNHVSSLYGLGRFLLQQGQTEEGTRLVSLSQEIRTRSGLDEAVGSQYGEQGPYAMGIDYPGGGLVAPAATPVRFDAPRSVELPGATCFTLVPRAGGAPEIVAGAGAALHHWSGEGAPRPAAAAAPGGAAIVSLAAGDLDGDAGVETAALLHGADGSLLLSLWADGEGGGAAWSPPVAAGSVAQDPAGFDLTLVDRDHDGDLDALACWSAAQGPGGCAVATNDGAGGLSARPGSEHGLVRDLGRGGPVRVGFSDLDNDRDVDLLVGGPAGLALYSNLRDGTFADVSDAVGLGAAAGPVSAFAVVDLDKDGLMDVLLGGPRGARLWRNRPPRFEPATSFGEDPASALAVFDHDNDGFLDVVRATEDGRARLYRNLGAGDWSPGTDLEGLVAGATDLAAYDADGDGDLDLLSAGAGRVGLLNNQGGATNRWLALRSIGVGDNRLGIGAKVEVLAGALRQKFEVTAPLPLHVGLGSRERVESVRYLWPSGVLQDEIQQPAGGVVEIRQLDRKGTSCPLLYAWSGERWRFVTDFLGGAAVGYRHSPTSLNVPDTDEYVKLEGGVVEDGEGRLRLRLNNQLEEVIWFDQVELVAVDHPAGTDVFPDEQLMPGPPWPEFRLFAGADVRPIASARGVEDGRDLTELLSAADRRFVANFDLLPFKGYAEAHTLELDLGPVPRDARVVLLLDGWIDYADSSANVAAHQAGRALEPPRLHVADGHGGWLEPGRRMGFPAGLPKTTAVDLSGLLAPGHARLRISTNMRIYYDRARVLVGGEDVELRVRRLGPISAELRHGGFPRQTSPDGRAPFAYDPQTVDAVSTWKAHVGRYTAFGEVRDLLQAIDDRFVTTRNGDEIEVAFRAPEPVAPGWTRTYLLHADGFGKDMDPNSAASDELGPIPFHGMPAYPYATEQGPPQDADPDARVVLPSDRGWPGALPQALAAASPTGDAGGSE